MIDYSGRASTKEQKPSVSTALLARNVEFLHNVPLRITFRFPNVFRGSCASSPAGNGKFREIILGFICKVISRNVNLGCPIFKSIGKLIRKSLSFSLFFRCISSRRQMPLWVAPTIERFPAFSWSNISYGGVSFKRHKFRRDSRRDVKSRLRPRHFA